MNGNTRKNIIYSGNFHYDEPIAKTQGTLLYDDADRNKCIENGLFNASLQMTAYGSRKVGNHHIIGLFTDGQISNPLVLQLGIIKNDEIKINDDKPFFDLCSFAYYEGIGRTDI